MACEKRETTGSCGHYQCPYPEENGTFGITCVEVIEDFCELGSGCFPGCEFSWPENDETTMDKAVAAYTAAFRTT